MVVTWDERRRWGKRPEEVRLSESLIHQIVVKVCFEEVDRA